MNARPRYSRAMPRAEQQRRLREARKNAGLTLAQVGEAFGITAQAVAAWEGKGTRPTFPTPDKLEQLAQLLGVTTSYLLGADDTHRMPPPNAKLAGTRELGRRDLPVYASARGGHGEMVMSGDPIDFTERPSSLQHVTDAFAVYVVGESMEPRFSQGELLLIHPHRPVRPGSDVLIELAEDRGERSCMVKRLVRITSDSYELRQFNPAEDFTIPRDRVLRCMLIVGTRFVD